MYADQYGELILYFDVCFSFDFLHKKQSGGAGQFGRVIGRIEVSCTVFYSNSELQRLRSPAITKHPRSKKYLQRADYSDQ